MKLTVKLAIAVVAIAATAAGCIPKTDPPPPPFRLAAGIWHTFGTAPGASECHFARVKADGRIVSDVHSPKGSRFVEVQATDRQFITSGCQNWVRSMGADDKFRIGAVDPNPQRQPGGPASVRLFAGDGDYRVYYPYGFTDPRGLDASYGTYQLANGATCRWERVIDWTGEGVVARGDGAGDGVVRGLPNTVTVETTDAGIRLFNCGSAPAGFVYWYGFPLR